MKKRTLLFVALASMGLASASQAVVIHWAATVATPAAGTASARLVYVTDGVAPTYTTAGVSAGGYELATVSGLAVTPGGVGEQATTFAPNPSVGAYYVVLFDGANNYRVSTTALSWDNTTAITTSELAVGAGAFDPGSFTSWTEIPVPEPTTGALFCIGGAVLAWRRRKRS